MFRSYFQKTTTIKVWLVHAILALAIIELVASLVSFFYG